MKGDYMSQKEKIKENILQMNASYIVTDPSGTTLKSVGKPLADHGYKIQLLNLMDLSHSNKYNPFKYFKTKEEVNNLRKTHNRLTQKLMIA